MTFAPANESAALDVAATGVLWLAARGVENVSAVVRMTSGGVVHTIESAWCRISSSVSVQNGHFHGSFAIEAPTFAQVKWNQRLQLRTSHNTISLVSGSLHSRQLWNPTLVEIRFLSPVFRCIILMMSVDRFRIQKTACR